jgi:hypothetical protein
LLGSFHQGISEEELSMVDMSCSTCWPGLLKKRLLAAWKAARKRGKMSVSGEPKGTAVSREIMPADGSNPAWRNERGFRHVPANGGRPSDESAQLISHQQDWQRVRIAVIFPTPQLHCLV